MPNIVRKYWVDRTAVRTVARPVQEHLQSFLKLLLLFLLFSYFCCALLIIALLEGEPSAHWFTISPSWAPWKMFCPGYWFTVLVCIHLNLKCICSVPAAKKHSHNTMPPSPRFTVWMVLARWCPVLGVAHTYHKFDKIGEFWFSKSRNLRSQNEWKLCITVIEAGRNDKYKWRKMQLLHEPS